MADMKIHEYKKKDVSNAMVIVSFPTVGLVSTIVANFLVSNMKLERIGAFESEDFYPAAIIQDGLPSPPVRIYAGDHVCGKDQDCDQLVVISSELPIKPSSFTALADKILAWCKAHKCKLIVTIEGINSTEPLDGKEIEVFHVGSNKVADKYLKVLSSKPLENGMVSGLSGVLLYKANMIDYPVASLLAEAHAEFPDSRSSAEVLRMLDKLVPQIKMDLDPLIKQAKLIEEQVKKSMSQIKPMAPTEMPEAQPGMYR